jgi:hypothetical protein
MGFMDDLQLLEEPIELSHVDPEKYPDVPAIPPPPVSGNYVLKANFYGLKQKEGVLIKYNNHPVFELRTVEIVEPLESARKVRLWQDVKTEEFQRNGEWASQLHDLQRALDQTKKFTEVNQGLKLVGELLAADTTFKAKLDWTAYDKAYVEQEFVRLTGMAKPPRELLDASGVSREVVNAIYKKAKLTSMWMFPKKADGTFNNIWTGVDGTQMIEARPTITRYYASLEPVRLGPARN